MYPKEPWCLSFRPCFFKEFFKTGLRGNGAAKDAAVHRIRANPPLAGKRQLPDGGLLKMLNCLGFTMLHEV